MKERLFILTSAGETVLTRDLAEEKGPLLVVVTAGAVALQGDAKAGDDVLGALVRDDDGWSLASAKAEAEVVSGPKRANSLPLLAGQPLLLGGFVFKIEGESTQSGRVLLWRVGASPVAADSIIAGRNAVVYDVSSRRAAVNPALEENVLFEFYPDGEGIEVVSRAGEHLAVGPNEVFEVGDFRALVLSHADATEAMKSRNPFAWPSRRARRLLVTSLTTILGILVVAGFVNRSASSLEDLATRRARIAQKVDAKAHLDIDVLDDEKYLFLFTFYRDLPLILQAEEALATRDLVKRIDDLADREDLRPIRTLLEAVIKCQRGIASDRWSLIEEVLKEVPRSLFETYGADSFYDDILEIDDLVRQSLPDIVIKATAYGHEDVASLYLSIETALANLNDNRFRTVAGLEAFVTDVQTNISYLREYIDARNALLGTSTQPPVETAQAIAAVTRTLATIESVLVGSEGLSGYAPLITREKALLKDRLAAWVARPGLAGATVDLAEVVGVEEDVLESWRQRAVEARRAANERVRRLYRAYRLSSREDAAKARAILDEIVEETQDDDESPFADWARRERVKRGFVAADGAEKNAEEGGQEK